MFLLDKELKRNLWISTEKYINIPYHIWISTNYAHESVIAIRKNHIWSFTNFLWSVIKCSFCDKCDVSSGHLIYLFCSIFSVWIAILIHFVQYYFFTSRHVSSRFHSYISLYYARESVIAKITFEVSRIFCDLSSNVLFVINIHGDKESQLRIHFLCEKCVSQFHVRNMIAWPISMYYFAKVPRIFKFRTDLNSWDNSPSCINRFYLNHCCV